MEESLDFNKSGKVNFSILLVLTLVFMVVFVLASAPVWDIAAHTVDYHTNEDSVYIHNFSKNITGFNNDVIFDIDTQVSINWTNASGTYLVTASEVSEWILMTNSSSGEFKINATKDNQTGFFIIHIQATNISEGSTGENFEFQVNATNDAPNFTTLNDTYNLVQNINFFNYINATDEESHYPLNFSLVFDPINCTHASWSGYNDNENCSLIDFGFNLSNFGNESASINFTPTTNHVGIYWANFSVTDYNSGCPHSYCDNSTYETNLTTYYTQMVKFEIDSSLSINVSNCTGQSLVEDTTFNCTINITTIQEVDSLNLSTYASFRTWGGSYYSDNRDWFYSNYTNSSSGFILSVPISIDLTKREVGNWTINFTATDGLLPVTESIYLFVNYTEDNVSLNSISGMQVYENKSFNITAIDADFFILDGSVRSESLTFASNTSWVSVGSGVNLFGTNYSTAQVDIDYSNVSVLGDANYTILINVTDAYGNFDQDIFTLEIYNDTAAEWNDTEDYVFTFNEDENIYINLSEYVNDTDDDSINFSYISDSSFDGFNLTVEGIINFTPTDVDVGYHNLTINASDGKLDSLHIFNFTIYNINDTIFVGTISNIDATEDSLSSPNSFSIDDDDFLIPSGQKSFYNESLTIDLTFTNLTVVESLISYNYSLSFITGNTATYTASFTPNASHVGTYNVTVNVTDVANNSNVSYYTLTINSSNDAPVLSNISNQSLTIYEVFYLDINSTDEEDSSELPESGLLNYVLDNLTIGGDFLTINITSGEINLTLNSTYEGAWHYNLTVNDTEGSIDYQDFWVYIYGAIQLISPSENITFNLTENVLSLINLTLNHSVGDNLTFEFFIDSISCSYQNSSNCSYGNSSLKELGSYLGNGSLSPWSYTSNYTSETYGNLKNFTLSVYPNSSSLNSTQRESLRTNFTFYFNISHTNHPPEVYLGFGPQSKSYSPTNPISLPLTSYIRDYDYLDSYYLETVNFSLVSNATNSIIRAEVYSTDNRLPWNGTISDWSLQLFGEEAGVESITINADDSYSNVTSDAFTVTFSEPETVDISNPIPRSGSSSNKGSGDTDKLKHFSLKIIAPQDVIISDDNYIEVPFSIQNKGELDLVGINLSSHTLFNGKFSEDISISLNDAYIPLLRFGQSENFTMRISANTQKSGRYKATIFANVTSPKFSDFGDFFIDLRRINESEAEQILIFTEKLISENPECLELTENLKAAENAYLEGDVASAIELAKEIISSCEDAIKANEQIRYAISGFVEENFFYIFAITLGVFLMGFVIYVYKRVRFNKSRINDYI